jgi:hypothetical protein
MIIVILLPAHGIERAIERTNGRTNGRANGRANGIERAWREYLHAYVQPAVSRGCRSSIATPSG